MTAVSRLDRAGATRRAQRARDCMMTVAEAIDTLIEIQERQDWLALGYKSWSEYCEKEFGPDRLKLSPEQRGQVVAVLVASGMPKRRVAAALGVTEGTIRNDFKKSRAQAPEVRNDYALPAGDAQVKAAAAGGNPAADEASSQSAQTSVDDASAGTGDDANVAGPGKPPTADGPLVSSDGEPATPSTTPPPAAGAGAPSEADRPAPAVNPTDHPASAVPGAPPVPDEGGGTGDETDPDTSPQESGEVDGEQEREGVSAPAPTPVELLEELVEKFQAFDVDALAPRMTSAELDAMQAALKRVTFTVGLFETWYERTAK